MQGIQTNNASLIAQRNLNGTGGLLQRSIERLSSGLRVNSAKDDAAGLAIAERMTAQIRGSDQAKRNANDGISALQVADGGLASITENLQRMRELAVQSQNGTLTNSDRENLDLEYQQLSSEVRRVADSTQFNGNSLLDGGNQPASPASLTLSLQIGDQVADKLDVNITNVAYELDTVAGGTADAPGGMGIASTKIFDEVAMGTQAENNANGIANADTAVTAIDGLLNKVTSARAVIGASVNRLENVVSNLDTFTTNLSAARGRIMDADFAVETSNLTRAQILQQAGTAMLAQANQLPSGVLGLLGR